jgi:hypothetical protein
MIPTTQAVVLCALTAVPILAARPTNTWTSTRLGWSPDPVHRTAAAETVISVLGIGGSTSRDGSIPERLNCHTR